MRARRGYAREYAMSAKATYRSSPISAAYRRLKEHVPVRCHHETLRDVELVPVVEEADRDRTRVSVNGQFDLLCDDCFVQVHSLSLKLPLDAGPGPAVPVYAPKPS